MGIPLGRLSDKVYGRCHSNDHSQTRDKVGIILGSSTNVLINGLPAGLLADKVLTSCDHIGIIVKGSTKTIINGKPASRIGDKCTGDFVGVIYGASTNVNG